MRLDLVRHETVFLNDSHMRENTLVLPMGWEVNDLSVRESWLCMRLARSKLDRAILLYDINEKLGIMLNREKVGT